MKFRSIAAFITTAVFALTAFTTAANAVVTIKSGDFEYLYNEGEYLIYSYLGSSNSVSLPESYAGTDVTGIYDNCFKNSAISSVSIPEGYRSIGSNAFNGCSNLKSVSVPKSVSKIGSSVFAGSGVETVDLSQSVISTLPSRTFADCASLNEVKLPESVKRLGDSAFKNSGIISLTLPKKTASIGTSCFEGSGIGDIILPAKLKTIGTEAFKNATGLKEIFLPDYISSIGQNAFYPMSLQKSFTASYFGGTYAENYCYDNYFLSTESYSFVPGDVNLDGVANVSDVTLIQKYRVGLEEIDNPAALILGDVNASDSITVRDATLIQMYIAKIITNFPTQ